MSTLAPLQLNTVNLRTSPFVSPKPDVVWAGVISTSGKHVYVEGVHGDLPVHEYGAMARCRSCYV